MTIKECEEGYHLLSSCHVCPFLLVKLLGYDKETFSKINWLCLGIELKYIDLLWLSLEGNNNNYSMGTSCFENLVWWAP